MGPETIWTWIDAIVFMAAGATFTWCLMARRKKAPQ
jgi:hypothetical protein